MSRGWNRALLVLGLLTVGLVLLVVLFEPDAVAERRRPELEARLSERLGRRVTLGAIDVELWPLGATISEVRVAGRAPTEAPLLEAPQLVARLAPVPFLLSFGRRLEIEEVSLVEPRLSTSRFPDGRWSHGDVVERLSREGAAVGEGDAAGEGGAEIEFSEVRVARGRVIVRDRRAGRTLEIRDLALQAVGLAPGGPLEAEARGVLVDGARRTPAEVGLRLSRWPARGALPAGRVRLRVDQLRVAPWASLLEPRPLLPVAGVVSADLDARLGALAALDARGTLRFTDLDVRGAGGERLVVEDATGTVRFDEERPGAIGFALDRVRAADVDLVDVKGRATLRRGALVFDALELDAWGGRVIAGGSRVDLVERPPSYRLTGRVDDMDVGAALRAHTELGGAIEGAGDLRFDLSGRGLDRAALERTLRGQLVFEGERLTLTHVDVAAGLLAGLQQAGAPLPPRLRDLAPDGTTLRDFEARLRASDRRLLLDEPLRARTGFGALTLEGAVGFDGALDLAGTASLGPALVEDWTGGLLAPSADVDVPLRVIGSWAEPRVVVLDARPLVRALVRTGVQQLLERAAASPPPRP